MRVTLWGTRGSLAAAGPDTVEYGGDTSAVLVEADDGTALVLDAGSGVRAMGEQLGGHTRIDVLLTHLHMDHIQGLGFFGPLFDPRCEVHIWGPASRSAALGERLRRYLSPPLFPVRLRDLHDVVLHEMSPGAHRIGPFTVSADYVIHPGTTMGYRIEENGSRLAYMPDHEPALGSRSFPESAEWTSGHELARGVDVLIHDAQYTGVEYEARQGWGHSSFSQLHGFATLTGVDTLVSFHHDPSHTDAFLDVIERDMQALDPAYRFVPGKAQTSIEL